MNGRLILAIPLVVGLLMISGGVFYLTQPDDEQPRGVYVGSVNSNIYHYPYCKWAKKIKRENEVWFISSGQARDADYRPCKVCRPP